MKPAARPSVWLLPARGLLAAGKPFLRCTLIDQIEVTGRTRVLRCCRNRPAYLALQCHRLTDRDVLLDYCESCRRFDAVSSLQFRFLDRMSRKRLSLSTLRMESFRHISTFGHGIDCRLSTPGGCWVHRLWNGSLCVVVECRCEHRQLQSSIYHCNINELQERKCSYTIVLLAHIDLQPTPTSDWAGYFAVHTIRSIISNLGSTHLRSKLTPQTLQMKTRLRECRTA